MDSGAAMKKEVAMKTLMSNIFAVLTALLSMSSLALPFGVSPAQVLPSATMQQNTPSVVYKNTATENQLAGTLSVDQIPGFRDRANTPQKAIVFRTHDLSITSFRSNMLVKDDRASFTVNAPMQAVNGALTFVGTVAQTPLESSLTRLIQVISLVATRKINAELAYSAKMNSYSRFDSVITYRLHPNTDSGKSDVVASINYKISL